MSKRYIPPELKGMQEAPGFWPVKGAPTQEPRETVKWRDPFLGGRFKASWPKRKDKP